MRILVLVAAAALLGGCSVAPPSLVLPGDLRTPCEVPRVSKGAIRALAEHRVALLACRDKHQRLVRFVDAATGRTH